MKHIVTIILLTIACAASAQVRDFQMIGDTPIDSFYVLVTDTVDGSPTKGRGTWMLFRIFKDSLNINSSGSTDLTIGGSGPTYTIESSTGTDVTIQAGGINALSESPANTLVITATEVDGSTANELENVYIDGVDQSTGPVILDFDGTDFFITESPADQFDITISQERIQDMIGSMVTANVETGITFTYNDASDQFDMIVDDESETNEGILGVGAGGASSSTLLSNTSGANAVTINVTGIATISESTSANGGSITIGATEADGSPTNEAWTVDADAGSTEVISNQILLFQGGTGIVTTYTSGVPDEVMFDIDGSEFTTVTTVEADDYMLMWDDDGPEQKMLWSDFSESLITFYDGAVFQDVGNAIDVGAGLDINMVATEANINLDASEFQTDGTLEGTEFVIVYDADTTAGHRIQKSLVSSFGGADGNGIYGGDGTAPADVDVNITDHIDFEAGLLYVDAATSRIGIGTTGPQADLHVVGTAGAMRFEAPTGSAASFVLEGKADSGSEIQQVFAITDADGYTGAEFTAMTIGVNREADVAQFTSSKFTMNEGTDADAIVLEKQATLSDLTTESHVAFNGGIAMTQNHDYSTSADLQLDRSFYTLNVTGGGVTDTIKLPEVAGSSDNWLNTLTSTQCQVGQTFVITNFRTATNLVIAAYNPAGTGADDLIDTQTQPGTVAGSAISITPNSSVTVRCVRHASNIGYWYSYD